VGPGLPSWLADPALDPVWAALRSRLERRGVGVGDTAVGGVGVGDTAVGGTRVGDTAVGGTRVGGSRLEGSRLEGTVRLGGLERATRHALAGVLGRDLPAGTVRLDLAALDASLRERAGLDLATVVAEATGEPLRDRPAERVAAETRRQAPLDRLAEAVRGQGALAGAAWGDRWLADVRSAGLLTREPDAFRLVDQAVEVLAEVLVPGGPARRVRPRSELAARHGGDAHALDEGRPLHALVLRALVAAADLPEVPIRARDRRDLWERAGVPVDRVSTTCLLLGVRAAGESSRARRLRSAAADGDPVHLTRRDLAGLDLMVPTGTAVLICENPTVLDVVAHAARTGTVGSPPAVVCTSGWPSLVCLDVLTHLSARGARLRYHGDFDWPGLEIANYLLAETGARPWRMAADHYRAAVPARGGLPLEGRPVAATWDAELRTAMSDGGFAVHEEAVLDELLDALGELAHQ
jgi:uncharacterized protein (TIGR02679 family)